MKKIVLKESELVNIIQKVISEQSTPPGPNGYPGGVPCYACILNHPVMRTFPQNAVTSNGNCAPTGYGYQGTQYALPGGSASYSYPSIWSTTQPTNCGSTPTPSCNKNCSQLVPSSFSSLMANKPCNWLNNRHTAFLNKLSNPQFAQNEGNCQYKRVQCKIDMVNNRKSQLSC